ncbi:MAG: Gx transporter family protein [Defluviitaleaceae bacterium]|nr:Gx transporter family protein [Defluviitaleaceae bacterium]MCL2835493.1 Gx transporter family protein [Defluviitaleaceae bacterium]
MAKKTAYIGILTALAVCLAWLERLIPLDAAVPGVKLGLSNTVTLITMHLFGGGCAFGVTAVRVLLTGAMYSGVSGIIYSAAGGFLSCAVMIGLKQTRFPTVIGVSIAGGVFHNIGQLLAAALVVENAGILYYLPILIVSGAAAGVVTGLCARLALIAILKAFPPQKRS